MNKTYLPKFDIFDANLMSFQNTIRQIIKHKMNVPQKPQATISFLKLILENILYLFKNIDMQRKT